MSAALAPGLHELVETAAWMGSLAEDALNDAGARRAAVQRAGSCVRAALELLGAHSQAPGPLAAAPPPSIAVQAAFALRARQACLVTADVRDRWQVLAAIDGIARELARTTAAVDASLGIGDGAVDPTREAIAVRRGFVRFVDAVVVDRPPRPLELAGRLRLVVRAAAELVAPAFVLRLRPRDRALVGRVHAAIAAHLGDGGTLASGLALWQEAVAAAEQVMAINHRRELVAHDLTALHAAIAAIDEGRAVVGLRDLLGCDPQLDRAIRDGADPPTLRAALADALSVR